MKIELDENAAQLGVIGIVATVAVVATIVTGEAESLGILLLLFFIL